MKINKTLILTVITAFSIILIRSYNEWVSKPIEPGLVKALIATDSFNQKNSVSEYKQWIDQEISTIWQEIQEITTISLEDCIAYQKKTYPAYLEETNKFLDSFNELKPVSQEITTLIKNILAEFKVDPATIRIIPFNHFCPAAGDDCSLLINEELFGQLKPLAQRFCIAHELQHFIFKDNSIKSALITLTKLDTKNLPVEHPINKLSRMIELRADIYACFAGTQYTQGYQEFIDKTFQIIGDGKGLTHPKTSLRLSYAQQLKTIVA